MKNKKQKNKKTNLEEEEKEETREMVCQHEAMARISEYYVDEKICIKLV